MLVDERDESFGGGVGLMSRMRVVARKSSTVYVSALFGLIVASSGPRQKERWVERQHLHSSLQRTLHR
jgi:hypothetical protein